MQSSEILSQPISTTASPGWLTRLSWREKVPAAFFFGCLLGLSSPGFDRSWLAWIGLVPLLVLLRSAFGRLEAIVIGGSFGLGYQLVALSWYLGLFPLNWLGLQDWLGIQAALIVWVVEALHQTLLVAAFSLMVFCLPMRAGFLPYFRRPFFPFVLSVPLLWVFFQWAIGTSEMFIGLPVNQLAYSQFRQIDFIQLARLGGCGLLEFIMLMMNAALAQLILEWSHLAPKIEDRLDQIASKAGALVDLTVAVALILAGISFGHTQLMSDSALSRADNEINLYDQTPTVPVAVVQGNITIEEDRLKTTTPTEIADRYSRLDSNLGVPLMVFPEGLINRPQMAPGLLLSRLKSLTNSEKKEAIVGSIESVGDGLTNAARLVSPANPKNNLYVKRRLVPFAEFVPLGSIGQDISNGINEKIPVNRESFLAAHSTQLLSSTWGRAGVSIFVELVYPSLISDEVRRGANLLVNISNLSWFHSSALNKQILAAAVMRAVENGRYFVLSTNTGISAVIDPSGMVTSMSYPNRRGVLLDTVQFLWGETPFTKMWWL